MRHAVARYKNGRDKPKGDLQLDSRVSIASSESSKGAYLLEVKAQYADSPVICYYTAVFTTLPKISNSMNGAVE
jgi:hypothetical protein